MWGKRGRTSAGSDVIMLEDHPMASEPEMPAIANLNVTNSSRVHLGPKFVNVNQTVHNSEVIKDLPLPSYLCTLLKSTTRLERLSCAAAVSALIICITIITYFSIVSKNRHLEMVDVAPHEWNITRAMWLATPFTHSSMEQKFMPLKLVIVQHTVTTECHRFVDCAAELRTLQSYFLNKHGWDIPYTFLIGNDGRVYEGRGYGIVGAHTFTYNTCSIGLGFIGDYREEEGVKYTKVTEAQINRTMMLLEESVKIGYLDPNYFIVGAKDLQATESPGTNLYNALRKLDHYDHQNRFANMTCDTIYEQFYNQS